MELAPVVLFIYNRPQHLLMTLKALSENDLAKESLLIIYADGPKENATDDEQKKIYQAREIARSQKWCKEIRLIERRSNFGLSNSIISGVTEVVEEFGRVIVLEDDLDVSPFFLRFMNEALNAYQNEEMVLSIGACNFFGSDKSLPDFFFIPIPDCLGWATWADRWKLFETDGSKLLFQLRKRNLTHAFNLFGAYDYEGLLKKQIAGKTNSWAIRWQALSYVTGKLNLYPKYALTNHRGADKDATNSPMVDYSDTIKFPAAPIAITKRPVCLDSNIMNMMLNYYRTAFAKKSTTKGTSRIKVLLLKFLPAFVTKMYESLK